MTDIDTLVIGGGQAGLATAHHLLRTGRQPVIAEAGPEPTGSWPRYYDSLTLFSPARHSTLPDLPFDGDPHRYPTRDEVVDYLRRYAAGLDADIRTHTTIESVTRHDGMFTVVTGAGQQWTARQVVSATGGFTQPHRPTLPGLDTFDGQVLHSADYRHPAPFAEQKVIVVGAGNSAVQIAVELAELAVVTLTSRQPVKFLAQRPLGRDIHDWLRWSHLEHRPISRALGAGGVAVLDDGRYRAAIQRDQPLWRPMFTGIEGDKVIWADATVGSADTVILATGFRSGLDHLNNCMGAQGRAALNHTGRPVHRHGASTTVPGLGYVGLEWQRGFASATLRGVGPDANLVVKQLHRTSHRH